MLTGGRSVLFFTVQVGWDESTAGERQQRVSVWDIEPLTTPFLLCPPPPALRSKRTRGNRGKNQVHCFSILLCNEKKVMSGVTIYEVGSAANFRC
jgi:hypothetical protein